MADAVAEKKTETAPPGGRSPKKKKSRPTNCLQSNKRIRRKDWYYREGKYFANKQCFKLYKVQELEKAQKAKDAASAIQASAEKPAEEKTA